MNNTTEIKELNRVINSLTCQIKGIAGENDRFRDTTDEQRATISSNQSQIANCHATIEEQNETIHNLNTNIKNLERALEEGYEQNSEFRSHLQKSIADRDKDAEEHAATLEDENNWLWNQYNQLTRMVLESDLTILGKDQTIDRLEGRLDNHKTHISKYDTSLKECNKLVDERDSLIKGLRTNITNIIRDRDEWRQSSLNAGVVIRKLEDRKEDSKTLVEVVKIVNNDTIQPYRAIDQLADLLVDYLDVPKGLIEED